MNRPAPFWILKFSGTALQTPAHWENLKLQVETSSQRGAQPLLVLSALAGATDHLERLIDCALHMAPASPTPTLEAELKLFKGRYLSLAQALNLEFSPLESAWRPLFQDLERWLVGASLTGEAPPRLQAKILACGELLTLQIAETWLRGQFPHSDLKVLDPLEILSLEDPPAPRDPALNYLSAWVGQMEPNLKLQERLQPSSAVETSPSKLYLLPGYLAANKRGERVLLGRGGSDLSATLLALQLQAQKVQFWTKLPGFYSADPQRIPSARLLLQLDYAEAQELASVGTPVVHPRAIALLGEAAIPLEVRCADRPHLEGTRISPNQGQSPHCVKALTCRRGVTLVSLEEIGMWQQVGFLSQVFSVFARHGLSIDLVATSQSNVTVSLDQTPQTAKPSLAPLLRDLAQYCRPQLIAGCAALSLVGQKMRSHLQQLGPALELFEEEKVHLLSQAASDLNFTFVVDESQAERLLKTLHAQLFSGIPNPQLFGSSYQQEFAPAPSSSRAPIWWVEKRSQLLEVSPTPAYVYDGDTLQANVRTLQGLDAVDHIFFAIKANSNPQILELFYQLGLGFECVSSGEVERVRQLFPHLERERLLFTPNFADAPDYRLGFERGAMVTLDHYQPLELWPELFQGREIFLRLDLGHGAGHSRKVRTAGNYSKFGIPLSRLAYTLELLDRVQATVIGLHSHSGSGIKTTDTWAQAALQLAEVAQSFPQVRYLDLGGGLGVPERRDLDSLDLQALNRGLAEFKKHHPQWQLCIEPGRFLVAQAGVLLTKVCQTKSKGEKEFIGCDAGMQTLLRPALYGAYHEIINLTRYGQPATLTADVVGPICETGDILGHDRHLPATQPGDILLIDTAGAYGFSMSSNYNLRPQAREIFWPACAR